MPNNTRLSTFEDLIREQRRMQEEYQQHATQLYNERPLANALYGGLMGNGAPTPDNSEEEYLRTFIATGQVSGGFKLFTRPNSDLLMMDSSRRVTFILNKEARIMYLPRGRKYNRCLRELATREGYVVELQNGRVMYAQLWEDTAEIETRIYFVTFDNQPEIDDSALFNGVAPILRDTEEQQYTMATVSNGRIFNPAFFTIDTPF
jgi:hypothetical protein